MARYRVFCHYGCRFSQVVETAGVVGNWSPPQDVDGGTVDWVGKPIEDVYAAHQAAVHDPRGEPPKCAWELAEY